MRERAGEERRRQEGGERRERAIGRGLCSAAKAGEEFTETGWAGQGEGGQNGRLSESLAPAQPHVKWRLESHGAWTWGCQLHPDTPVLLPWAPEVSESPCPMVDGPGTWV